MLSVAHFSPCWTHVYAFTVPSFSLVAPCCTHVSFRFSVSKNRKVLSHMRSVAHLLFAFRSAHVPLKFSGPKPIFESKTREHRVFSNMFFQPFLFKSFSCKQERPIWNSSSYISNFSLFRCASPVCFASLLFPPGVTEHRWNWSGPLSCRAAVIHPKITTAQKESEVPVLHPVIPEAQKIGMKSMRRDPFMVCTHYSPNTCVMWTYPKSALSPISCVQSLAYIIENHGRRCPSYD